MNQLIPIQHYKTLEQSVSARDLYLGIGLSTAHWAKWSMANIEGNTFFDENKDWIGFTLKVNGNNTRDYAVSIEFAKHIAMMAKTEKAHEYRNYFIECEKKVNLPQTYISALEALVEAEKQKEALRLELDTTKIQLDESMEWSSLKRIAHYNGVHWESLSWQLVKKCSFEVGRPPYKIFDANYDAGVNNYHITAWAKAYPELKFPEPLEHK